MNTEMNLERAITIANGARQKAKELGVSISVSVVDTGGRVVLVMRGDGTGFLTPESSRAKALAAAAFKKSTKELVDFHKTNPAFWEAVPALFPEKVLPTTGAVPIFVSGQIIGAVGCGGGSPDQDHECAEAGAAKA
jgi:glc operon protein GlcG